MSKEWSEGWQYFGVLAWKIVLGADAGNVVHVINCTYCKLLYMLYMLIKFETRVTKQSQIFKLRSMINFFWSSGSKREKIGKSS